MKRAVTRIAHRFAGSTRGIAAVEFGLIMPVLVVMFLSSFDAANAIAVYMKVRSAAYVLGAVTNTYGIGANDQISSTAMPGIAQAAGKVLAPYTGTPIVTLSQIKATSNTNAIVSWSYSLNGTALIQGNTYSSLPANFAKNTCGNTYPCYVIVASVSYTYTPIFGSFITGPMTFSDTSLVTPRVSTCIQYNSVPSPC